MNELPDRLLRGALRDSAWAAPSDLCADADALAAWADGTMKRPARAAFESHAADCARCQALMAAMARTEPPPVEPAWWRRSPFSWVMPLAAATAVIAIVVDQARTEPPVPAPPAALSIARQESAATANVSPGAAATAAPAPAPASPQRADTRRDALVTSGRNRPHSPAASRSIPDAMGDARKTESRAKDRAAVAAPTSPTAPLPVAEAPAPPPPAPAAAATAVARERAAARIADAPTAVSVESSRSEGASSQGIAAAASKATAAPTVIVSPNRDSQWRIVNSAIEHTTDGGGTWQAQPLGAGTLIRAGAAPAAQVCWLVGARGVVMLTTDGVTWRRIAFPELVDLAAIQASDDAHATVTTATGRSYVTIDGGKTWTRR